MLISLKRFILVHKIAERNVDSQKITMMLMVHYLLVKVLLVLSIDRVGCVCCAHANYFVYLCVLIPKILHIVYMLKLLL